MATTAMAVARRIRTDTRSGATGTGRNPCEYLPRPEQSAGPRTVLYGGTIASIVDCHSVGTAMAHFYQREGRSIGEPPELWCVTGRLTINYLKPTPIDQPVELRAHVAESTDRKAIVHTTVSSGGEVTATGETVAIRVAGGWQGA